MNAIEAATIRCQTMADGTLRVTLDIEPRDAQDAFKLFGQPGRAVAIAALKPKPALVAPDPPPEPKEPRPRTEVQQARWSELGTLCRAAVTWCGHPEFQHWIGATTSMEAGEKLKEMCDIESRKQLDVDDDAAQRFRQRIIGPYQKYMMARGMNAQYHD